MCIMLIPQHLSELSGSQIYCDVLWFITICLTSLISLWNLKLKNSKIVLSRISMPYNNKPDADDLSHAMVVIQYKTDASWLAWLWVSVSFSIVENYSHKLRRECSHTIESRIGPGF